jgi:hypothetical protein
MTSFDPGDSTEELPSTDALARGATRARRAVVITTAVVGASLAIGGVAWAAGSSGGSSGPGHYGAPAQEGSRPPGAPANPGSGGTAPKHTPTLIGTVKSSGNSTIVITDFDGFTRTIKVSSATKYDDSLTATPKVGTRIEAEGKVDADGTTLDATVVETPNQPAGPSGRGGPGGNGGAPPTGTKPTSKPTS